MGKPAIRIETTQDAEQDAPDSFDAEPAEAGPDIFYSDENAALDPSC
jgi:hypothetical protein